jgi:penicillin-binding protein 1A
MTALEQGMSPQSMVLDAPVRIGKWSPANFSDKYYGDVTLSFALSRSLNSVAARLVSKVGPKSVIEAAYRMGIESELQNNASIALGTSEVTPLELTAAYLPFANGGYRPFVHFIEKVSTLEGKLLWRRRTGGIPRVVHPQVVGMMNSMMSRTLEEGTGRKAAFGWPAAGKTGTTQSSRDVWFVGFTGNLTTGVWFGNDDNSPTNKVTGGSLPAIAWHDFMAAAHDGIPVAALPGWSGGVQQAPPANDQIGAAIAADRTASIPSEPVPGDPLGVKPSRVTSILDILLGN